MAKKVYKLTPKGNDKKKVINTISELTDAIIILADRQDKFEDGMEKLYNKQHRLQETFNNLIEVSNTCKDMYNPLVKATKADSDYLNDRVDQIKDAMFSVSAENVKNNVTMSAYKIIQDRLIESVRNYNQLPWYKKLFAKLNIR
jgi:hemoglobin-like flavoprotein